MNKMEKNFDLVDRYLEEQMSEEERADFESQIKSDSELKALKDDLVLLKQGIKYSERESMISYLSNVEKRLSGTDETKKRSLTRNRKFIFAIAAAVIVLFALFFLNKPEASNEVDLYSQYFESYPNIIYPVERSEGVELTVEQKAYYHYEAKNYEEAIGLFREIPTYDTDPFAQFYSSLALMAMEEYEVAIHQLENIGSENLQIESQIKWYLSLAYIHENKFDKAKEVLSQLVKYNNSYSSKAQQILDQINN